MPDTLPSIPPHDLIVEKVVPNYPSFELAPTFETATIASPNHTNDQSASGSSDEEEVFESFADSDSSSSDSALIGPGNSSKTTGPKPASRFKAPTKTVNFESVADSDSSSWDSAVISPGNSPKTKDNQKAERSPSTQGKQTQKATKNPPSAQGKQTPQKRKATEPAHSQPPVQKAKGTTKTMADSYVRVFVDGNLQRTTVNFGCKNIITDQAICKRCVVLTSLPSLAGLIEKEKAVNDRKVVFKFLAAEFISNPIVQSNLQLRGEPVYDGDQDAILVEMATRALNMEDNGEITTIVEIEFAKRQNFHVARSDFQENVLIFVSDSVGQPKANRISQAATSFSALAANRRLPYFSATSSYQHPAEFGNHGSAEYGHGK